MSNDLNVNVMHIYVAQTLRLSDYAAYQNTTGNK
jgi:hypothetical protein